MLKTAAEFDATSGKKKYVFGAEVELNFSEIEIKPSLAEHETGKWSLFKKGRTFANIHMYGTLLMGGGQGSLLIWSGNNTFF